MFSQPPAPGTSAAGSLGSRIPSDSSSFVHNNLDFSIPYFSPPLLLTFDSRIDLLSLKAVLVQATRACSPLHSLISSFPLAQPALTLFPVFCYRGIKIMPRNRVIPGKTTPGDLCFALRNNMVISWGRKALRTGQDKRGFLFQPFSPFSALFPLEISGFFRFLLPCAPYPQIPSFTHHSSAPFSQ